MAMCISSGYFPACSDKRATEALIKATVPRCSDGFAAVRGKKHSNTSSITSIFNEEMR